MKVKICGITNTNDALLCESHGADALGFIFYKESKRYTKPERAEKIIKSLSPFTMKIGVFVNEPVEVINSIALKINLNAVQLHGEETGEMVNSILIPVIKSFRIKDGFDFSSLSDFKNCYYLLDAYSENLFGGTGNTFNWKQIPEEIRNKIILSGGVSKDNVNQIINEVNPLAIDVSSSLEDKPGKKDEKKVIEFFSIFNKIRNN